MLAIRLIHQNIYINAENLHTQVEYRHAERISIFMLDKVKIATSAKF